MYTLQDAVAVADRLTQNEKVREIYLYGSLARRKEYGRDIDLIVTVDPQLADAFIAFVNYEVRRKNVLSSYDSYEAKKIRQAAVNFFLGENLPRSVDIFLFHTNWIHIADQLQKALPHRDQNFMRNVLHDVKLFRRTILREFKDVAF